jgi:hypothetical protein
VVKKKQIPTLLESDAPLRAGTRRTLPRPRADHSGVFKGRSAPRRGRAPQFLKSDLTDLPSTPVPATLLRDAEQSRSVGNGEPFDFAHGSTLLAAPERSRREGLSSSNAKVERSE